MLSAYGTGFLMSTPLSDQNMMCNYSVVSKALTPPPLLLGIWTNLESYKNATANQLLCYDKGGCENLWHQTIRETNSNDPGFLTSVPLSGQYMDCNYETLAQKNSTTP
jgi:hypothetical protein